MSPLNPTFRHPTLGRPTCPICNEAVCLENCKTDEDGRAMHEECYVDKVCSKEKPATNKKGSSR